MITGEMRRYIEQEVKKHLNIILSGEAGTNTQFVETIDNLFPGMPGIINRPVMHPYGFVSRAPAGTLSVTAKQGDHPGNRLTLGHRDSLRPSIQAGETQLYNEFGQAIYLADGTIHIGTAEASNPAVLGDELKAFLIDLITWLLEHTHVTGGPGSSTSPPEQTADLTQIQTDNVDNDKILSQLIFLLKAAG